MKTLFLLIFFPIFLLIERKFPFSKLKRQSLWPNIVLGGVNFICVYTITFFIPEGIFYLSTTEHLTLQKLLQTIVLLDGTSYIWHTLNHKIPWLWRLHRIHHSEITMDSSSAFRFHTVEIILSVIPKLACIYFFNLPKEAILYFEIIFQTLNMFQHANIPLPNNINSFLQLLIVTPAMHRNHHSLDVQQQNTNFSTVFSFWDRMLDTFDDNSQDRVTNVGLNEIKSHLTIKQLFLLPFKF